MPISRSIESEIKKNMGKIESNSRSIIWVCEWLWVPAAPVTRTRAGSLAISTEIGKKGEFDATERWDVCMCVCICMKVDDVNDEWTV